MRFASECTRLPEAGEGEEDAGVVAPPAQVVAHAHQDEGLVFPGVLDVQLETVGGREHGLQPRGGHVCPVGGHVKRDEEVGAWYRARESESTCQLMAKWR